MDETLPVVADPAEDVVVRVNGECRLRSCELAQVSDLRPWMIVALVSIRWMLLAGGLV